MRYQNKPMVMVLSKTEGPGFESLTVPPSPIANRQSKKKITRLMVEKEVQVFSLYSWSMLEF